MKASFPIAAAMFLFVAAAPLLAQSDEEAEQSYSLPPPVERCLSHGLGAKYRIDRSVNPFYLRGDFDGDGKSDYMTRIASRENGKGGMLVCWGDRRKQPVVLGAGTNIRGPAGGVRVDELPMIGWSVYGTGAVEQGVGEGPPPKLTGEAVTIYATEGASGILYWNGKAFRWYQQGD